MYVTSRTQRLQKQESNDLDYYFAAASQLRYSLQYWHFSTAFENFDERVPKNAVYQCEKVCSLDEFHSCFECVQVVPVCVDHEGEG